MHFSETDAVDPVIARLPSVEHLSRMCGILEAGSLLPRLAPPRYLSPIVFEGQSHPRHSPCLPSLQAAPFYSAVTLTSQPLLFTMSIPSAFFARYKARRHDSVKGHLANHHFFEVRSLIENSFRTHSFPCLGLTEFTSSQETRWSVFTSIELRSC